MSLAARHRDHLITIDCHGQSLSALLSEPVDSASGADASAASEIGVLMIVGGPQYRVGAHRQFTLLGRALAAGGVPMLRFDVRGMGDAEGEQRSFEQLDDDIAAAIDAWRRERPALRRVVLWGLCDGASAALLYVQRRRDPRVAALCLANPWVRTEASLARTQVRHYYLDRLRQGAFWRKLLSGRVGLAALRELLGKLKTGRAAHSPSGTDADADLPYTERMAAGLRDFAGPVLLLLSGDDYVAKEFLDRCRDGGARWHGLLARAGLMRHDLPEADHTFSTAAWRAEVEARTLAFVAPLARGSTAAMSAPGGTSADAPASAPAHPHAA